MAKTSLAAINSHFDGLVAAERKNPTPSSTTVKRASLAASKLVAGFDVIDNSERERIIIEGRKEQRAILTAYITTKNALKSALAEVNVKPLALLPSVAFHTICKSADLFYAPSTMMVHVDTKPLRDMMGPKAMKVANTKDDPIHVKKFIESISHGELMKKTMSMNPVRLTPVRKYDGVYGYDSAPRTSSPVRITLPQPPQDVMETILKAQAFKPQTVAVYDAISYADGAEKVLVDALALYRKNKSIQEAAERQYREWIRDPIVYVEQNGVVAVIAQFGDFPIEADILNQFTAATFLPPRSK
jgi:hypothetical protein